MSEEVQEEWRAVVGWEGYYEVSNMGNVRSMPRKYGKCTVPTIRKPRLARHGYYHLGLKRLGTVSHRTVHSMVAEAFIGPVPDGSCTNHIDGNKSNNRLANLEICTNSENRLHCCRVLGKGRGETHGLAVLTEDDVIRIRSSYAASIASRRKMKLIIAEICEEYGIGPSGAAAVVYGRTWKHVIDPQTASSSP